MEMSIEDFITVLKDFQDKIKFILKLSTNRFMKLMPIFANPW